MKLSNGDGIMGTEGIHKTEEIRVSHQDLLHSLGMGSESEQKSKQKVCYLAGDETRGLESEEWRVR